MKPASPLIVFALFVVSPARAIAADATKKGDAPKHEAMSINAAEIKWGEAPPDIPKGASLAVLHGDPTKKAPFTMRLKLPAG
jgi:hypothetical protein